MVHWIKVLFLFFLKCISKILPLLTTFPFQSHVACSQIAVDSHLFSLHANLSLCQIHAIISCCLFHFPFLLCHCLGRYHWLLKNRGKSFSGCDIFFMHFQVRLGFFRKHIYLCTLPEPMFEKHEEYTCVSCCCICPLYILSYADPMHDSCRSHWRSWEDLQACRPKHIEHSHRCRYCPVIEFASTAAAIHV